MSQNVLKDVRWNLSRTTLTVQRQLQKMQLRLCGIYATTTHARLIGLHEVQAVREFCVLSDELYEVQACGTG